MVNDSLWKKNIKNEVMTSLNEDIKCDILIIGGGMAGLSSAYFLSNSGNKIVLIERELCASGASSKNTGKLTFMQGLIYQKIAKNYSEEIASLYLKSQMEAIALALNIANENNIECDLFAQDSFVFNIKSHDKNKLEKEFKFYRKNNIDCEMISEIPINFQISGGIRTRGSYSFNPYKFLLGIKNFLKNKIRIYENSRAFSISREGDRYLVKVNNNYIDCNCVIVATQYPFFIKPYFIPLKTTVEKSFIVSGKCKISNFQAISADEPVFSFNYYGRSGKGYLLYSRRGHNATDYLDTREDKMEIVNEYEKICGLCPEYYFQNHDLMTYDYMPFIGKIDDYNMYVLTGFNKWGNTNGILGGKLISDMILDKENIYVELFNPKRGLSALKVKNLLVYNTKVITRYVLNKMCSNKKFYDDNVKIKYIDGKKCGIYIDEDGEHIVSNICPHMKCNLVFNYVDKTWDCPCHASRFDVDGNIICGPAVYDIKINKKK